MTEPLTTPRKNIMLGTAGHVDHGKTALVKLLTGCDTDTLAAEKQRGLTIEVGFAPCTMADERIVGIVDVPGHVGFIRNMVAGAQGVDVVVFVVAADDGVMPQTREHLAILTLMGVRRGIIALTKIDVVDAEMRELAAADVRECVAGTFLADVPICPISNTTGEGFDGLFAALDAAVEACEPRPVTGLFRMWVERSFAIHGFGNVVSGIPAAGEVRPGDRLTLLPGGQSVRVRKLQVYGHDAEVGQAGECVAMNLTDVDAAALGRGELLTADGACEPATMMEAELTVLPAMPRPLTDYTEGHIHLGTAEVMANVALLEGEPIAPGTTGLVQLRLREPLAATPGERFVLRASMAGAAGGQVTTLGGGRILDVSNRRLRRNRPWTTAKLNARREALDSPAQWCGVICREAADAVTPIELAHRAAVPADHVAGHVEALRGIGDVVELADGRIAHADTIADVGQRLREALEAFHAANPGRLGAEPAAIQGQVEVIGELASMVLDRLIADGAVERRGDLLSLPGAGVQLSAADAALASRVEKALRQAQLAVPLPAALAESLGVSEDRLDRILDADAVAHAKRVALDLFASAGSFTTMQFRDALGVSRKFAVPLLDYFDSIRFTARSGSLRRPGAEAKKLLDPS